MAKGPFLMPGTEARTEDWRDAVDSTAKPDQRRPTADEQQRGCVKGEGGSY